ncbi:MAG: glycosyltransferase family 4 protein [Azoarcus sp.]|jgi:glycosyltransferase involved in cell wall biosynthesis|nr:glycosyltransferase family 4 protein [Azoarcus sp.]
MDTYPVKKGKPEKTGESFIKQPDLSNKKPTVILNTYPFAFDVVGGGEVQLLSIHRELAHLNIKTILYDIWNPSLDICDIVHFFSVMPGSFAFCEHVRKRNIPLFVSPNMWLDDTVSTQISLQPLREQLSLADCIICNSDMESENFSRILSLPKEKFLTMYCGIDDIFLNQSTPSLFRSRNKWLGKFVLNVGTIEKRKNQLTLIRAMKAFPDYSIVLIGHIRDQAYANKCFAEGGSQIVYLGPLLHEDPLLRSAMAACDLFIGPGLMETPGGANLEAASQGAPLVITEVGSTREYFKDMVTYFNPVDEKSLIDAIEANLGKSRNETLIKYVHAHFQWRKALIPLSKAYQKTTEAFQP